MGEKKLRIHQVAKELGKSSKEVIEACTELGIEVKSHLSSVNDAEFARIREHFETPPTPSETSSGAAESVTSTTVPPIPPIGPMPTERSEIADLDQLVRQERKQKESTAPTVSEERRKRARSRPRPTLTVPTGPRKPPTTRPATGPAGSRSARPAATGEKVQQPKQALTPELLRKIRERQRKMQAGQTPIPTAPAAGKTAPEPPKIRVVAIPRELKPEREEEEAPRRGIGAEGRAKRRERRERRRREEEDLTALTAIEEDEEVQTQPVRPLRQRQKPQQPQVPRRPERVVVEPPITVRSFSEAIGVKATDILRRLITLGYAATINSTLEPDVAELIASDLGIEIEVKLPRDPEEELLASYKPDPDKMVPRPPVVTLLGHVDHGKTSLLDRIRRTNVAATEAGGITQCIRAWQVERDGQKITFLDTPGHEAFTAMRARGAQVTDIAVIVVAADDGVMPQTVEAISHAKAAGVDIVVAINKCDLPTARPERVLQQLAQHGIIPEEWDPANGVPCIRCSALTGEGIEELLDHILFLAEARNLRADPTLPAMGVCLEAARHEGRGVLATFLVQQGTLKVGDIVVCGVGYGRIRSMWNDQEKRVKEAGPGTPVLVSGLHEVPAAGDRFLAVPDIETARTIAEKHLEQQRQLQPSTRKLSLEELLGATEKKQLPLVIRADTHGSLEAIEKELQKFEDEEVEIKILHKDVGAITESDVLLAEASKGIVVGFNVGIEPRARQAAEAKGVDIRRYRIIYELSDDIRAALEGMLTPERQIEELGEAEVLQTFRIRGVGWVAGCRVRRGRVVRNAFVRVLRDGRVIYPDPSSDRHVRIISLKRFQDDVQEVRAGYECGIRIEGYDDIKPGDVLEVYEMKEVRRTLGTKSEAPEAVGAGVS